MFHIDRENVHLVVGLHGLQLTVVLTHLPHKSFFQAQHFVELDQLLGELSLAQSVMGREGFWRISHGCSILVRKWRWFFFFVFEKKKGGKNSPKCPEKSLRLLSGTCRLNSWGRSQKPQEVPPLQSWR